MLNDCYSPNTGEHIATNDPAPWMGRAGVSCPPYDKTTQGAFWRGGPAWFIADFVPEVPVPEEVGGWQAEVAMRVSKVDLESPASQSVWDRVQDILAAMPDGVEKITAQTVLTRGKVRRDSPTLALLAAQVPLSESRVDDLLRLAASIKA